MLQIDFASRAGFRAICRGDIPSGLQCDLTVVIALESFDTNMNVVVMVRWGNGGRKAIGAQSGVLAERTCNGPSDSPIKRFGPSSSRGVLHLDSTPHGHQTRSRQIVRNFDPAHVNLCTAPRHRTILLRLNEDINTRQRLLRSATEKKCDQRNEAECSYEAMKFQGCSELGILRPNINEFGWRCRKSDNL